MVSAFIGTASFKKRYQELGYIDASEWSERKAIAHVRKTPPAIIVADLTLNSRWLMTTRHLQRQRVSASAGCVPVRAA
jgi:hypothetical protein